MIKTVAARYALVTEFGRMVGFKPVTVPFTGLRAYHLATPHASRMKIAQGQILLSWTMKLWRVKPKLACGE